MRHGVRCLNGSLDWAFCRGGLVQFFVSVLNRCLPLVETYGLSFGNGYDPIIVLASFFSTKLIAPPKER